MEQGSHERKTGAYIEHQPRPQNANHSRLVGKKAIKAAGVQSPRTQSVQRAVGKTAVNSRQQSRSR